MPRLKIDTRILGSNGTQVSEVILFKGSAKHQYPHISNVIGYELLRVLLPLRGYFVDYVFHKAYHLTSFLKLVSPLATGAFGCYSVLITLPVIFFYKNKIMSLRLLRWYLNSSNWLNSHIIIRTVNSLHIMMFVNVI